MKILGVRVDELSRAAALEVAGKWLGEEPARCRQVITINTEMLMRARKDPAFRSIIEKADLVIPDGSGIVWASHLLGSALEERIAGIDLLLDLLSLCETAGKSVYLLGSRPGVAEKAAAKLGAERPGLRICGVHHGYFPERDESVVELVRGAAPDLLVVGMGSPRQESWIAVNRRRLEGVRVAIGVGGALDVIAGIADRAPAWMQNRGLEWLYRLLRQPSRAPRMLVLPKFALIVLLKSLTNRRDVGADQVQKN